MDAEQLWPAVRRLVPEWVEAFQLRMQILQRIRLQQPIGRRALAANMGFTERVLRAEVELLRQQGLVYPAPAGMSLTEAGQNLLDQLTGVLVAVRSHTEGGHALSRVLGIPAVTVVQGDTDQAGWVKDALAWQAALELRELLQPNDVLAVTGGTTMAALATQMPDTGGRMPVMVVPARGGLGEDVSIQANTIAARLAERLGGRSLMLHVPDQLSPETRQRLLNEPQVEERLRAVHQSTVVVHGIGDALTMARRRQLAAADLARLQARGAVAEAFGYFFDKQGHPVFAMSTVGLQLADLSRMRLVMAVAGGASKARAIAAAAKAYRIDRLVTDEAAAQALLAGLPGRGQTDKGEMPS
ncbi:MAG: DNA-binding transcriptional regulator [Alicyclobacillus sp.]|nr:DNA-binding transcriptional regulator [Alicyclobacillus sp.]